jgi:hypothetical protein
MGMVRTDQLGVRVSPDLKAALIAAAHREDRSLASLVERILREWLRQDEDLGGVRPPGAVATGCENKLLRAEVAAAHAAHKVLIEG